MTLKEVKWDKDLRIVRLDEHDLVRVGDNEEVTDDPGMCPPF